jgi:hypothetical protein
MIRNPIIEAPKNEKAGQMKTRDPISREIVPDMTQNMIIIQQCTSEIADSLMLMSPATYKRIQVLLATINEIATTLNSKNGRGLFSFDQFLELYYPPVFKTECDAIRFILGARVMTLRQNEYCHMRLIDITSQKAEDVSVDQAFTQLENIKMLWSYFKLEYYKFIKSHSKKPYNLMKLNKLSIDQLEKKLLNKLGTDQLKKLLKNARNNPK